MSSWKACLDKDLQKHFYGLLQNKVALIIDRGAVWLWPWLKNGSSIEPTSLGHKVSQPVEVCDISLSQSCLKTFQGKFFTRALYAIETWDWNRMSGFQRWDPHRNNFLLFREAEPQTRCIWRHAGTWLTSTWSQDISGIQKAAEFVSFWCVRLRIFSWYMRKMMPLGTKRRINVTLDLLPAPRRKKTRTTHDYSMRFPRSLDTNGSNRNYNLGPR